MSQENNDVINIVAKYVYKIVVMRVKCLSKQKEKPKVVINS